MNKDMYKKLIAAVMITTLGTISAVAAAAPAKATVVPGDLSDTSQKSASVESELQQLSTEKAQKEASRPAPAGPSCPSDR